MSKPYRFFSLRPEEQWLLIITYGLLNTIRLGLWLLPFIRLRNILDAIRQQSSLRHTPLPIAPIIWAINISCRYSPGHPRCLARALTAHVLMHRQGYRTTFKIGVVAATGDQLEAHAWVEYNGSIVIGNLANIQKFTPLPPMK